MFVPATGVPAQGRSRGSLLTAATVVAGPDRWETGFAWKPERCVQARAWIDCVDDEDIFGDAVGSDADAVVYHMPTAFEVQQQCSTVDGPSMDRVRRQAEAATSFMMARELMTGERAQNRPYTTAEGDTNTVNRYLTDGSATVIDGVWPVTEGLAQLEAAASAAQLGGQVFLHLPIRALPVREATHEGELIRTQLGSVVVADAGYLNLDPDGTPATGVVWAYATAPVQARVSPIQVDSWTDWQINRQYARATRYIAATYDPCVLFAVALAVPDTTP